MKNLTSLHIPIIGVLAAFLLTGCYTQLQTTHPERIIDRPSLASDEERELYREEARERRLAELTGEEQEEYLLGYEDGLVEGYDEGWTDAELYYFIDYDTRHWYRDIGQPGIQHHHHYHGYSPYTWHRPYWRHYYRYRPFYAVPFYSPWHTWYNWGWGFGYSWHYSPYAWHRYPAYGFYHRPHAFVFVSFSHVRVDPKRDYIARTTGLRSAGIERERQVRSSSVAARSGDRRTLQERREAIRSRTDLRSTGRTGTVNRSRGSVNRSSSSVNRSRSDVNRSRGNVNRSRSSGNVNRSRGNVNRSRSSGNVNRSSGNVNRSRSSGNVNRSSGNVNRSRSSGNVNRSSGTVNRSSGSSTRQSSATRSRTSRDLSENRAIRSSRNLTTTSRSHSSISDRLQRSAVSTSSSVSTRILVRDQIRNQNRRISHSSLESLMSRTISNSRAVSRSSRSSSSSGTVSRSSSRSSSGSSSVRSTRSSSNSSGSRSTGRSNTNRSGGN